MDTRISAPPPPGNTAESTPASTGLSAGNSGQASMPAMISGRKPKMFFGK